MPVLGAVGDTKQQGLREIMFMEYEEEFDNLNAVIPTLPTKKAFERWTGQAGPGRAELKSKGMDMTYKDIFTETPKEVVIETYGLGIRIAFEDMEDNLYDSYSDLYGMVGRSHKVVQCEAKANFFNGAFLAAFRTGYDGKALLDSAHTLSSENAYSPSATDLNTLPSRSATTWSNRLTTEADFEYLTFIEMVNVLKRTVTREGDYTNITPSWLVGPTEQWAAFKEVLGSSERPDTANRGISAVSNMGITIVTTPYIVDTDSSYLGAKKHDLKFFLRMELKTKTRDAIGSWDILEEGLSRFGYGFHNPRGWTGTKGG